MDCVSGLFVGGLTNGNFLVHGWVNFWWASGWMGVLRF